MMLRQVRMCLYGLGLLALVFASACGTGVGDRVRPGLTPVDEVQKILGQPQRILRDEKRAPGTEALAYEADPDCTYQRMGGVIVQVACKPKPHQTEVQYWFHQWKGQRTTRGVSAQKGRDLHGSALEVLHNPGKRELVLFDAEGRVEKVVRYGRP